MTKFIRQAVFDEWENPTKMVGYISKITDRKRAEEAYRQREESLQLAIMGSNDAHWN